MKRLLFSLIGLLILILVSCNSENNKHGDTRPTPTFSLQTLDGETFHSQALDGNVAVVDFWATWCKPCVDEIPEYNSLYEKYRGQNFKFISITLDSGSAQEIAPYVSRYAIRYPVYVGNHEAASAFGGIQGYPTTFILDQNGNIQKKYLGNRPGKIEEIEEIVSQLLEKG